MKLRAVFITFVLLLLTLFIFNSFSNQNISNTIRIEVNDFYFKPENIRIKSGQKVEIELVNKGKLEHEFMVGRLIKTEKDQEHNKSNHTQNSKKEATDIEHNHQKDMHGEHDIDIEQKETIHIHTASFEKDFFNGIEVTSITDKGKFIRDSEHGTMLILEPGGTATLSFNIPDDYKGEWVVACFIPGHYEANMRGKIIIE